VDSSPTAADGFPVLMKWVPMLVLGWLGLGGLGKACFCSGPLLCYRSEISTVLWSVN
jgi:hypothetical protein